VREIIRVLRLMDPKEKLEKQMPQSVSSWIGAQLIFSHVFILVSLCIGFILSQYKLAFLLGTGGSHLLILATQETEIRRTMVRSQPGQIVRETLSRKNPSQKKRAGGVSQGISPEFKPLYRKNNNKKIDFPVCLVFFFLTSSQVKGIQNCFPCFFLLNVTIYLGMAVDNFVHRFD
jgi:hypothetical protein